MRRTPTHILMLRAAVMRNQLSTIFGVGLNTRTTMRGCSDDSMTAATMLDGGHGAARRWSKRRAMVESMSPRHRKVVPAGIRVAGMVAAALACAVVVSSCSSASEASSGASMRHTVISRLIPGVHVGLTPTLDGGYAGWCIAATRVYTSRKRNGAGVGGCTGARPSTGPIFVETCSQSYTGKKLLNDKVDVVVLTRGEAAAVTVAGGTPIPTESNSTLPNGLRAAAIELPGYRIARKSFTVGYPWLPCPRVTPLDASGKPIDGQGRSAIPLSISLPRRYWYPPARPPSGVCQIAATRLPRETVPIEGTVVTRVRPFPELIGHALIACADTIYFYQENHDLPAAVLLDAAHPGAPPPGLPGMKPLAGHPSIFEAPSGRYARRIRGAWLVVQEEDNIGPSVPLELLEHLRVTVHL